MEVPSARSRFRFAHLPQLAGRLAPGVLERVTTVWLDAFPDDPSQWRALAALPALRALVSRARPHCCCRCCRCVTLLFHALASGRHHCL